MHAETWLARGVLVLGAAVLIATSRTPHWREGTLLEELIESEGAGNDKLVRVRVLMSGALAKDAGRIDLRLSGSASRPASDLSISWLFPGDEPDTAAPLVQAPLASAGDFLTVSGYTASYQPCPPEQEVCEVLFEGRISTPEPEPYSLELVLMVSVGGSREDRPRGRLEITSEVVDAP